MQRLKRFALLMTALMLTGVSSARATVIPVSADATLSLASPNTTLGTTSNLRIDVNNYAVAGFSLSALPSGTNAGQISKATLTLYVNRISSASAAFNLYYNGCTYTDAAVTQSSYSGSCNNFVGQTSITPGVAGSFLTLDVTGQVKAQLSAGYVNFQMSRVGASDQIVLDSKENDATGHAPVLDVTLVNQGPAGANGSNGQNGAAGQNGSNGQNGTNGTNGGQIWSANIAPPSSATTGIEYASPSGLSTGITSNTMDSLASVSLLVPLACTAGDLQVVFPTTPLNANTTVTLLTRTGTSLLSCTVVPTINGDTCTSTGTASVAAGTAIYYRISGGSLDFNVQASFTCQ